MLGFFYKNYWFIRVYLVIILGVIFVEGNVRKLIVSFVFYVYVDVILKIINDFF